MSDENSQNCCMILLQFFRIIKQRNRKMPPVSYTTMLFQMLFQSGTALSNNQ